MRDGRSRPLVRRILAASVIALALALPACAPHPLEPPVIIGLASDKPGVTFRDPVTGVRSGFDVFLAEWMADHSEGDAEPFAFVPTDVRVDEREDALRRGDEGGVDLVISSYTITGPRERLVDFAGPYLQTQQGVMVRANDPRRLVNPSQLSGYSVCAERGSTSIAELREIPGVIVTEGRSLLDCVTALREQRVDAVSTDQLLLHGTALQDPGLRVESGVRFGALQQYGVGLPPEEGTASCEVVTEYIRAFLSSGAWDLAFELNFGAELDKDEYRPTPRPCRDDAER